MSEGEKTFMVLWIPKTRDNGVRGGDMKTGTGIQREEVRAEKEGTQHQLDNPDDLRSIPQL